MKHSKLLLKILFVMLFIPLVMFSVDYGLACLNKPPLFALKSGVHYDGGTRDYHGIGYKIIDYNELDPNGRQDVVFISKFIIKGSP